MTLGLDWITIDARDPAKLARFWVEALGYDVLDEADDGKKEVLIGLPGPLGPRVLLLEVRDDKTTKNRLHFDLRPGDQEAEVARLKSLGATEVDIGQGEPSWVMLADPEGNEFCVLRPLEAKDYDSQPWRDRA